MTEQRANELRSMLCRELTTLAAEVAALRTAIRERRAREIVMAELLALLQYPASQ